LSFRFFCVFTVFTSNSHSFHPILTKFTVGILKCSYSRQMHFKQSTELFKKLPIVGNCAFTVGCWSPCLERPTRRDDVTLVDIDLLLSASQNSSFENRVWIFSSDSHKGQSNLAVGGIAASGEIILPFLAIYTPWSIKNVPLLFL